MNTSRSRRCAVTRAEVVNRETQREIQRAQLLLAEYQSVRDESSQARQAQQSTIAWSLASFATVFAGGLLFISNSLKDDSMLGELEFIFFLLVFGVMLPGFAFASCMTYVGELARMERAGYYLRGLEYHLASTGASLQLESPLRWETFLAYNEPSRKKYKIGYIGGVGLYTGSILVSLVACVAMAYYYSEEPDGEPLVLAFARNLSVFDSALCAAVVIFILFLVIIGATVRSINKSSKQRLVYIKADPAKLRKD